jgi:tRNA(Ile)-lysidine synthetase-like protein
MRATQPFGTQWLTSRLADLLPGFPDVRLLIAFSGGVDSTALLAALAANRPNGLQVRAVHVNHGLHPNASKWSEHCRALARELGVPLEVLAVKVARSAGVSLEAAARDARYGLLARVLEAGEFLLTAHHEDDQVETVLLQLFRGAGIAGLAAMPDIAAFAGGWLARPLLSRSRAELEDWARGAGLSWADDDTNADETLDRNYLRRRVLPLIRERWPGVGSAVSRSARHAAEGQRLLDMIARSDTDRASSGPDLFVPALRALQPDRRRNALRFWIARSGARVPDTSRLEELAGPVIDARPDANPRVTWGDVEVQRHADVLSINSAARGMRRVAGADPDTGVRRADVRRVAGAGRGREVRRSADVRRAGDVRQGGDPHQGGDVRRVADAGRGTNVRRGAAARRAADSPTIDWPWRSVPVLELPDAGGTLELKPDAHGPIDLDVLPATVTVRYRQGGERLRPRRGGPRRTLKSLLQESHLPIGERARLPLVFSGETLLAVGSLWVDESIQVTPGALHRGRLVQRPPRTQ